jgi:hypothetical protein
LALQQSLTDSLDSRYKILYFPNQGDTTFMISTYTINKVKYNNYFITINYVL